MFISADVNMEGVMGSRVILEEHPNSQSLTTHSINHSELNTQGYGTNPHPGPNSRTLSNENRCSDDKQKGCRESYLWL